MKKLFLVLLAGALFVACGNKAEEPVVEEVVAEEPVVEEVVEEAEPVVEETAVVEEETTVKQGTTAKQETTVKQEAKKAAKNIARETIKVGEEKAVEAINNDPASNEAKTVRRR